MSAPEPPGLSPWSSGAALALLAFVTYLPALSNGFAWDDDVYITRNMTLAALDGLRRIWFEPGATVQYYPLTFSTFWVEVHLWGLAPLGFHLDNVLLHAVNAILLWRLLLLLELPGAWLVAALFAVHPVHVESVAWVTERKNVLSTAFALGSSICFLRHSLVPGAASRRRYAASLALFTGALLAKTVTCSLPAALLLVLWWKRGKLRRDDVLLLAPFFALGAGLAALTAWVEHHTVGAHGSEWTYSPLERMLIAGRALWFYTGKLAWPHPLMFNYPAWSVDASDRRAYGFPLAAAAVVAILFLARRRLGRGPLAAVLIFCGALLPVLGFLDFFAMRYSFVADHFLYLPSIPLLALAVAVAAGTTRNAPALARVALAAPIVLVLCALTWAQTHAFRDEQTLWRDTLAKNPASWMAHNNLGSLLSESGHLTEAIPHWEEAMRLDPRRAEIHENLGGAAKAQGRLGDAEAYYRTAIELDPSSFLPHMNLGVVLTAQGRLDEAVEAYRTALALAPGDATTHNDLGVTLASLGRLDEAMREYEAALAIDPTLARAHSNLGFALAGAGRIDEALRHDAEATRLDPTLAEAHNNYAIALERAGRDEEAVREYETVARLAPDIPEARYNLAAALAKAGKTKEAIAQYGEALRLRPDFRQAEVARARLLGE